MEIKDFIKVELSKRFNSRLFGAFNKITSAEILKMYFDKYGKKLKYCDVNKAIKSIKKEGGKFDLLMNSGGYYFANQKEFFAYVRLLNRQSKALNELALKYKYINYSKALRNDN